MNVAQATPTVTINPVTIIYGTALANSQLSGTVTSTVDGNSVAVPGTFTYTSPPSSPLPIGNNQSEAVTFTPTDTTDYTTVSLNVTVNVLPIPPTVTVTDATAASTTASPFAATGTATGVGGVNIATSTNPTFYYYLASAYDSNVPDLQLISWGDGSGVPTSGKNLVIVGTDNNSLLHIRIFDVNGVRTDTFETFEEGQQRRARPRDRRRLWHGPVGQAGVEPPDPGRCDHDPQAATPGLVAPSRTDRRREGASARRGDINRRSNQFE